MGHLVNCLVTIFVLRPNAENQQSQWSIGAEQPTTTATLVNILNQKELQKWAIYSTCVANLFILCPNAGARGPVGHSKYCYHYQYVKLKWKVRISILVQLLITEINISKPKGVTELGHLVSCLATIFILGPNARARDPVGKSKTLHIDTLALLIIRFGNFLVHYALFVYIFTQVQCNPCLLFRNNWFLAGVGWTPDTCEDYSNR